MDVVLARVSNRTPMTLKLRIRYLSIHLILEMKLQPYRHRCTGRHVRHVTIFVQFHKKICTVDEDLKRKKADFKKRGEREREREKEGKKEREKDTDRKIQIMINPKPF